MIRMIRTIRADTDHRLLLLLAVSALLLFAATHVATASESGDEADAAEGAPQAGPPELIKLYKSKALGGELRLPGLWLVSDVPDGVRAVEPDQPRPAAIEVGAVALPGPLAAAALADAVVAELGRSLGQIDVELRRAMPTDDKNLDRFYLELEATEHDARVRYGVLVVTAKRRALIASLGAPAERFEDFAPRELLVAIVDSLD